MKLFLKIILSVVAVIALFLIGGFAYLNLFLPNVEPSQNMKIVATPEMLERGEYLANHVSLCMDCHAQRDWRYFYGPPTPGTEGSGGDAFDENLGFPGTFYSKNITPHGLKDWSDGDIYRAMTVGVNKEGEPLFPVMPYTYYRNMDPQDLKAIIAYIRSLKPVKNEIPERHVNFPFNLILRTIPTDSKPGKLPSKTDKLAYGKYMANASACIECHTQADKGQIKSEWAYAGGREFKFPNGGVVRSANITPDKETGIGNWTEEQFIQKFKFYLEPENPSDTSHDKPVMKRKMIPVKETEFNSIMPWGMYAGMTEDDLSSIYTFLMSNKPIINKVNKFSPSSSMAQNLQ